MADSGSARRYAEEQAFHDHWAEAVDPADIDVENEFVGPANPENSVALSVLGDLGGKRLLDVGCGYGVASVYFALRGARVMSVDISAGMLRRTQELAARHGVADRVETLRCPIEELSSHESAFDAVYGYGVLHHADLLRGLRAVRTALKPNGRGAFVEPLGVNPIINLYRRISPGVRTEHERPLRLRELRLVEQIFPGARHVEVQLTSMVVYALLCLMRASDLQSERPWKTLCRPDRAHLARLLSRLSGFDKWLLSRVRPLGLLSWATVIEIGSPTRAEPGRAPGAPNGGRARRG